MPRTTIALMTPGGPYPATLPLTAGSIDVVPIAADAVNLNQIAFGTWNKILIIAQNTGAGARTFTITSAPDLLNRTGDITAYSLDAGDFAAFFVERAGWKQTDGYLYLAGAHAEVQFFAFGVA